MSSSADVVAVVVPARNEARHLGRVLEGMPAWVDIVIVVDDGSHDGTDVIARVYPSVVLVQHERPRGVGAAISSGYAEARRRGADIAAVMAGDAQMDPADLGAVVAPIRAGRADYVKGNRLIHPEAKAMPRLRRWGTAVLGYLTSWAIGRRVRDSQCGYTALRTAVLDRVEIGWSGYGYPNEILARLAAADLTIAEVPVRPVYGDEASGLRVWHVGAIVGLLVRARWRRIVKPERRLSEPAPAALRGG